jgi:hypothetical protein
MIVMLDRVRPAADAGVIADGKPTRPDPEVPSERVGGRPPRCTGWRSWPIASKEAVAGVYGALSLVPVLACPAGGAGDDAVTGLLRRDWEAADWSMPAGDVAWPGPAEDHG